MTCYITHSVFQHKLDCIGIGLVVSLAIDSQSQRNNPKAQFLSIPCSEHTTSFQSLKPENNSSEVRVELLGRVFSILIKHDKLVYKCHFSFPFSLETDEVTKSEQPPCRHEGDKNKGKKYRNGYLDIAAVQPLPAVLSILTPYVLNLFLDKFSST